jgi:hypothetical protein
MFNDGTFDLAKNEHLNGNTARERDPSIGRQRESQQPWRGPIAALDRAQPN